MLRKYFILLVGFGIIFGGVSIVDAGVGEATAIFLQIPPGARAGGMGEAYVAIADDATATWWNPAGLAFMDRREISFMHANWLPSFHLPDLYIDYISYVNSVEYWGTFGLSVFFLNLGETEGRDEFNYPTGTFRTYETSVTGSYGSMITDNLGLGLNVKFIYSHLADRGAGQERGTGVGTNFAVDIGVLYKTTDPLLGNPLSLGANLANLGTEMAYIDRAQADPIP
ncbi:MAG: PorV/PorQ family protein, partial [Candidatus Electryoneaceae bacterium]|nr:PorV/PorQ family protein [Candidatus Electryoneaceae bacterium]